MTYEKALKDLETIVNGIENGQFTLDQLTTQLKKAKELIAFCKDTLHATSEQVDALLSPEEEDQ